MNKPVTDLPHPKMLLDPYAGWAANEGVPITEDFGVDLLTVPTAPWARFDTNGGIVHLKGRGDFVSIFVLDLAPGAKTSPQKHLFEEVVYVLSGHGRRAIETSDGRKHSFEWGPKSLFALPLNARYQHFNSSGRERARLASTNNLAMMLNLFHNESFVFDNAFDFPERAGRGRIFQRRRRVHPGAARPQHVGDQFRSRSRRASSSRPGTQRGAGGSNMMFILADGTMHAHISRDAGRHLQEGAPPRRRTSTSSRVTGHGYSLLWYEGDKDFVRVDWQHGWVFAPPDQMFHQHFNTAPDPARYLAVAFGSLRYPFTADKRRVFTGMDVSVKDGGCQIEYEDQDPRIHRIYLEELARHGVKSGMAKFIDERPYAQAAV